MGDEVTSRDRRINWVERRSPWFAGAFVLLLVGLVGTVSWYFNHDRGSSAPAVALIGADLKESDLVAARLPSSVLIAATLDEVDLTGADLRNANLTRATAASTIFVRACLRDTNWDAARLSDVRLDGADIRGADFAKAVLVEVKSARGMMYDETTNWPTEEFPPGAVRVDGDASSTCEG